jgi:hypothetical protein
MVRLRLSNAEIRLWDGGDEEPAVLGTLRVDSAVVGLLPFPNRLGGISFATVENDWELSSTGIEFDEELLAATLQELVFGEAFETRYRPLWSDALQVGGARFEPSSFRSLGGYLVVELAATVQANK